MRKKIPPEAKKMFGGVIFDIYQWEQKLYDGSSRTFECARRPNTVQVIPLVGDKVYYAVQEQPGHPPFLSLFGGRADPGEEPIETAKRELLEETGLVSDDWHLLRVFEAPSKVEWHVYFFVARHCRKVAEQELDGGEKIEIRTAGIDEFLSKVVADENFQDYEIRRELMSAFNPIAAASLKKDILG